MVDTPRTLAALLALFLDNETGDISEQDLRDFLVSVFALTTKGDVLSIDAAGIITRLAVGGDTEVLTADSGEATGLKWAAVGGHVEDHDHDGDPTQKLDAANTHESVSTDTHHAQSHAPESHSDTDITGAELETLSDTSDADALHGHSNHGITHGSDGSDHDVVDHDTSATGAELDTLTDGSDADSLHDHSDHGVTHNAAHGISAHTEHANWKVLYTDGSSDEQELALGTDGQVLKATGASSAPAFEDDESALEFFISGGGSEIADGIAGWIEAPFDGEITAQHLLADQEGDIKIDIWKQDYDNYPPTNGETITGGNEPEISSGMKDEDETLTDWTTAFSKGDIFYFNVDSATDIEGCLVSLSVRKT